MLKVGPNAGKYAYILSAELYSALAESKVIEEAAMRSGISKGAIQAAWAACGDVIVAWATEGHSVPVPGLGTMRFGVNAQSVLDVNMVASSLITSRKIVFTPSVDVKAALKASQVTITCYDRNGKEVKRVNSSDPGTESPDESGSGSESGGGSGGNSGGGSGGNEDGGGSLI